MQTQLYKRGFMYSRDITSLFDLTTEKCVKNYQIAVGLLVDGIVRNDTWTSLFASNEVYSDTNLHYAEGSTTAITTVYKVDPNSKTIPRHDYTNNVANAPYFNSNNADDFKKSDIELKINFGINSPKNEIIKHIFLRSSSVEVDGSGMPICKVYEFIAQDVI